MINPTWYPDERQLRQFAMIALPGFGLLGFVAWYVWTDSLTVGAVCWGFGGLVFLAGLARPDSVRPVYLLLMGIAVPIGWLISNLFLRLIFYGVMTPVGLVFRLIGRDPLQLRRPDGPSYWQNHVQRMDVKSYYRQA